MDLMQRVVEALREVGIENLDEYIDDGEEVVLTDILTLADHYKLLALIAMHLNGKNGIIYRIKREDNVTYITATN